MKNKDNEFWLNLAKTALMVIFMLVILVGITNRNKKEEPKEETKVEEKKEFRNSEKILWDLFLEEAKQKNLIHEDNLESINLDKIVDYGKYVKKTPNIRYENINYTYSCKDKTLDCVDPSLRIVANEDSTYTSLVEIDLKNKKTIKFLSGCSFNLTDELVNYTEPFVYEGEEN